MIPKKKLSIQSRPDYHTLEAIPGVEPISRRLTNGEMDRSMPVVWRHVVEPAAMKGADLMIGSHMAYCTIRFIALARANSWGNFKFYPADSVRVRRIGQESLEPLALDYQARRWPPERWYPDRHFELAPDCNQLG